jgi:hypothetical protein
VGLLLQFTQDDRDAVLVWQAAQLSIKGLGQVVSMLQRHCLGLRHAPDLTFPHSPSGPRRSRFQSRLVRYPVEPVGDQFALGDGSALPGQHEERRLEGVLDVMMVPEETSADAPDHRAVTSKEGLECSLVSMDCESIQEAAVR